MKEWKGMEVSGTLDDLFWKLSEEGVLMIKGKGTMKQVYSHSIENNTETQEAWQEYREQIKQIVIEDGVTNISDKAFAFCSQLEKISIAASVKELGKNVFDGCYNLSDVSLPEGLEKIGEKAFSLREVTSIVIPASVQEIGYAAFWQCYQLESVEFKGNPEIDPRLMFWDSDSLKTIIVPCDFDIEKFNYDSDRYRFVSNKTDSTFTVSYKNGGDWSFSGTFVYTR
jgi:hypothetical protein